MWRCAHEPCWRHSLWNFDGHTKGLYCKQHAEDGMINVVNPRCAHDSCTKNALFNVEGSKRARYCKQHSGGDMVNVLSKRCSHNACTALSNFNLPGRTPAMYCKKHATSGMVNVMNKICSRDSCPTRASYNVDGDKTAKYCKHHAEDGMVNTVSKRCSHAICRKRPSFNVEGSKGALYCKQHARGGMVNVRKMLRSNQPSTKRQRVHSGGRNAGDVLATQCSHSACVNKSSWGLLTEGAARVCGRHKGDVLGDPAVNFRAHCKVSRCGTLSSGGLGGEQPTHCPNHGQLEDGLLCTVALGKGSSTGSSSHISDGAERHPSLHVKTECLF